MRKVLVVYADAGFGHRKVAEAIGHELKSRNQTDLHIEILDVLDQTNPTFKKAYPGLYFRIVQNYPWLWGFFFEFTNLSFLYPLLSPLRTLWNRLNSKRFQTVLKENCYDFIIFTHFFPAEVCATMKRRGEIHSHLITVVTDVIPHRVWENKGTDLYWVMAKESLDELLSFGVSKNSVKPNGIPISNDFVKTISAETLRSHFKLTKDRLTVLFTSGSFGFGPAEQVLSGFNEIKDHIQVLVVCGKNADLEKKLKQRSFDFPIHIFGFVNNMHELMSISDIMISKPGGATMCESLAKGLPMIILSPIPGQESYNAKWLIENHAAFGIKTLEDIKHILTKIVNHEIDFNELKAAVTRAAKPRAAQELSDYVIHHE